MLRPAFMLLAAAALSFVAPLAAQDGLDAVRALHAQFAAVEAETKASLEDLMKQARAAERGSDEQKRLMSQLGEIRTRTAQAKEELTRAFAKAPWREFDKKADAAVLKACLPAVLRDLERAQDAVDAGMLFLAEFGDDPLAESIRANGLPMALLAAGRGDEARGGLRAAISAAQGAAKARMLLLLGDMHAAEGDAAAAAKAYEEADGCADDNTRRYVGLRKELIGKPAPEIDSKTWIGGEARPLSSLRGKVVLVDFWATWCGPCRAVMPGINKMFREHQAHGLQVMGVTRFYASGYLPKDPSQMQSGGESVRSMTEETYPSHIEAFRANTQIDYPFVIAGEDDFKNYKVSGIPTLAVVGKDGNIALVTVGSGSEALLEHAVRSLLRGE